MNNINYQEVHDYLSSGRLLKQFIKRCDHGLLHEIKTKISSALIEWEKEAEKLEEKNRLRNEKKSELLALIIREGFTPEELTDIPIKQKRQEMKYLYIDGGKNKKWSGKGRVPRALQENLNNGALLSEFLIDSADKIK